jgi:hypothetical protein
MKLLIEKLNGWQRLFIVLTVAIQLPLTLLFANTLPVTNPIAKELNAKFQRIAEAAELPQTISIDELVTLNSTPNGGKDSLIELYKESERRGLGKLVAFHASHHPSITYYVFLDNLFSEAQHLKIGEEVQNLIDKEFFQSKLNNYMKTFAYSILLSFSIYVLGMSISWVIKGFKAK